MPRIKMFPEFPPTEEEKEMINNMEIKESNIIGAGRGVFAKKFIPKGAFIGWYRGKIVTNPNSDGSYALDVSGTTVCGKKHGNFTSIINCHTGTAYPANVQYNEDGSMSTLSNIQPGEELYADYGESYWTGRPELLYNTIKNNSLKKKTRRRRAKP
jgi:SET domain-containing protein